LFFQDGSICYKTRISFYVNKESCSSPTTPPPPTTTTAAAATNDALQQKATKGPHGVPFEALHPMGPHGVPLVKEMEGRVGVWGFGSQNSGFFIQNDLNFTRGGSHEPNHFSIVHFVLQVECSDDWKVRQKKPGVLRISPWVNHDAWGDFHHPTFPIQEKNHPVLS